MKADFVFTEIFTTLVNKHLDYHYNYRRTQIIDYMASSNYVQE